MTIREGGPGGSGHHPDPSHYDDLRRAAAQQEHEANVTYQQWQNWLNNPHTRTGTNSNSPFSSSDGLAGLPSTNPSASYWLQSSEESRRLEDYRSTPELPQTADTVIVGSGITGAFAAWFLLEQMGGAQVPRSGAGSSGTGDGTGNGTGSGSGTVGAGAGFGTRAASGFGTGSGSAASASASSTAGQQPSNNQQQQPWERHNVPWPSNWREGPESGPESGAGSGPGLGLGQSGGGDESYRGVLMLEARQPCSGATGRNGGHCQPLLYSSTPSTAEFELATYRFIKAFVEEHGIAGAVDWRTLKSVHGYLTEEVWEGAKGLVEELPEGLRGLVDLVDGDRRGEGGETLRDLRVPGVKGAVVQRHAASLWPYKLVAWVLERLLGRFPVRREDHILGRNGGRAGRGEFKLQTNTPVLGLHKLNDGRWIVVTSRGNIRANRVLLAMNGHTSNLLPEMKDLIVPVRSQVASLRPPKDAASGKVAELDYSYAFVSEEKFPRDEYLIQRPVPGGELIYGGARSHAENKAVGVWQDDDVERGVATYLRQNLAPYPLDLTPDKTGSTPTDTPTEGNETTELKATHQWTGIMGFSRDASPWVGRVPESLGGGENLYVCAGYTGHGMPQAALAARMIVEEITGKPFADDGLKLPREMALTEERVRWVRENTKTLQEQQQAPGWSATMPELLAATERRA